jgi:Alternative complex III, ActD subunit
METSKVIQAIYTDDDVLIDAVKKVKAEKHHIEEVYTPFPVHGLDKAMGLAPTRIAITSFIYGCIGLIVAIWMMNYMMIQDWPQNIGGKPSFSYIENMPAFIPIMFELTVFFAAHLMVITFYMRSRMWPFKKAENPDLRTTDDHFLMEIPVHGNEKELETLLKETGAVEINLVDKEAH